MPNVDEQKRSWNLPFLEEAFMKRENTTTALPGRWALIVLNQPFHRALFDLLWSACQWRIFADGGSNRVFDLVGSDWRLYQPNLITGDLDSIRPEVQEQYTSLGVNVIPDADQYATDLMKCMNAIRTLEQDEPGDEYSIIILGGLSGRLDQTIHTMSYLHKLRKQRRQVFVTTDDNVAWVLDEGEHDIHLDRTHLGPTCGLLPVGVGSSKISMKGLEWNWTDHHSSFDGDVSTSNWLAGDDIWIKTTAPIWWSVELRLGTN